MPKVWTSEKQGVNVSIGELSQAITNYGGQLYALDCEYGDFRLQVVDGTWQTHTGDSQYDTDHRGCWSYAAVERGITKKAARELARTMIEECA